MFYPHLFTQLVDKLIKAEVHLRLHFVKEKSFPGAKSCCETVSLSPEHCQSMERRVVVEIKWIEDALNVGGGSFFEDVVCEDPREGHLDGELDPFAHRHLQVELSVPQLAQIPTFL